MEDAVDLQEHHVGVAECREAYCWRMFCEREGGVCVMVIMIIKPTRAQSIGGQHPVILRLLLIITGMRNSNMQAQREYYNQDLSQSRYSSQTSRKLRSQLPRDDFTDAKTRFLSRIEKACTTMSSKDVSKQLGLYRREIERLQKQLLKKDKVILQMRATAAMNKELEVELIETYRIIYMYEGKINQFEKQLKRLEVALSSTHSPEIGRKVEELLESYRSDNAQLMGRLEESIRLNFQLEQKLKRVESKYFSTAWKLSSTNRETTNPLRNKFPNLRNTITIRQTPLLEKEKALGKTTPPAPPAPQVLTTAADQYQITDNRSRPAGVSLAVEKEPIRFKREAKPDPRSIYYQDNSGSRGQLLSVQQEHKGIEGGRRESSITERKVYASPITRYELNRKVEEVETLMDTAAAKRYSLSNSISFEAKNSRF